MSSSKSNKPYDEEDAEIELLYAQARKHAEIGKKLEAARARLNAIGDSIEAAAGPINGLEIYRQTQELRATNDNVLKVLERLSVIQKPLEGKADEERIIQEGPERAGLKPYIDCINRITAKYQELSSSNARVNQEAAAELNALISTGTNRVMNVWNTAIDTDPIDAVEFLSRKQHFPMLPKDTMLALKTINQFEQAKTTRKTSGQSSYAEIRGKYLYSTLKGLAIATLNTAKRPDNTMYKQGDCAIFSYSEGVLFAFVAEWDMIRVIFKPEDHKAVFEATTSLALNELENTLEQLNNQIKDNLSEDCFLAYDILEVINNLAFQMEEITGSLKQEIFGIVKPVRDTAKQSLSATLDDIQRRITTMVFLPNDGAVIPFTEEILKRQSALVTYTVPLQSILSSIGDGNWSTQSTPVTDRVSLVAHYLIDMIEILLTHLETRSKSIHKNNRITGLFMLNNIALVDRTIDGPMTEIFAGSPLARLQDEKRKRFIGYYTEAWRDAGLLLLDVQYTNRGQRPTSGSAAIVKSLSSKDKDAIKEKFKNFNILFESLIAKHRELMPAMETEVRSELGRDIRATIEPLYARFWDRYHELDKGKGKYVRYDKAAMGAQLASLV